MKPPTTMAGKISSRVGPNGKPFLVAVVDDAPDTRVNLRFPPLSGQPWLSRLGRLVIVFSCVLRVFSGYSRLALWSACPPFGVLPGLSQRPPTLRRWGG